MPEIGYYIKNRKLYFSRFPNRFDVRQHIKLLLLEENEMTFDEIADYLGLSVESIMYHVNKLELWGEVKSRYGPIPPDRKARRIVKLQEGIYV